MAKYNYYPTSLNIQIVQQLLAGESATLLQNEFHIPVAAPFIRGKNGT